MLFFSLFEWSAGFGATRWWKGSYIRWSSCGLWMLRWWLHWKGRCSKFNPLFGSLVLKFFCLLYVASFGCVFAWNAVCVFLCLLSVLVCLLCNLIGAMSPYHSFNVVIWACVNWRNCCSTFASWPWKLIYQQVKEKWSNSLVNYISLWGRSRVCCMVREL